MLRLILLLSILCLAAPKSESFQGFLWEDFLNPGKKFTLRGQASYEDSKVKISKRFGGPAAYSFWYNEKIDLCPTTDDEEEKVLIEFKYQMGEGNGGDGFAMVIQNMGPNYLGHGGGHIGLQGLSYGDHFYATEFDCWEGWDESRRHRAFSSNCVYNGDNGNLCERARADYTIDRNVHEVKFFYDKTTGEIEMYEDGELILTDVFDLVDDFGHCDAYIGFTGGTWSASNDIFILSWSFDDAYTTSGGEGDNDDSPRVSFDDLEITSEVDNNDGERVCQALRGLELELNVGFILAMTEFDEYSEFLFGPDLELILPIVKLPGEWEFSHGRISELVFHDPDCPTNYPDEVCIADLLFCFGMEDIEELQEIADDEDLEVTINDDMTVIKYTNFLLYFTEAKNQELSKWVSFQPYSYKSEIEIYQYEDPNDEGVHFLYFDITKKYEKGRPVARTVSNSGLGGTYTSWEVVSSDMYLASQTCLPSVGIHKMNFEMFDSSFQSLMSEGRKFGTVEMNMDYYNPNIHDEELYPDGVPTKLVFDYRYYWRSDEPPPYVNPILFPDITFSFLDTEEHEYTPIDGFVFTEDLIPNIIHLTTEIPAINGLELTDYEIYFLCINYGDDETKIIEIDPNEYVKEVRVSYGPLEVEIELENSKDLFLQSDVIESEQVFFVGVLYVDIPSRRSVSEVEDHVVQMKEISVKVSEDPPDENLASSIRVISLLIFCFILFL